jgi:hypothetical protein
MSMGPFTRPRLDTSNHPAGVTLTRPGPAKPLP